MPERPISAVIARSSGNPGCGEPVTATLSCKREPGHAGVHEAYRDGKTITAPNERGWIVVEREDEDGAYWCLVNGWAIDSDKFDSRESADAACDIVNRRGLTPHAR